MAELVDAHDSKSCGEIHESSILSRGTVNIFVLQNITLKKLIKLGIFPFLVYAVNEIFYSFWQNFYTSHSVDSYFHFVGGVSIAFSSCIFLEILEASGYIKIKGKLLKTFLVITLVALAALLWEIYEFTFDQIANTTFHQPSNFDTMKDMILGLIGGVVYSIFFSLWSKSADGTRERNALTDVFNTSHPAYDSLKTDTKTRMRD